MNPLPSRLFIFSGLPGVGKTTLAKMLSCHQRAVYLRIDTVEQAIRELCSMTVEAEGYRLSYRLAVDNLSLGNAVVADAVNPIELTRKEWEEVARRSGVGFRHILVTCSDPCEHRQRVERRAATTPGLPIPDWEAVQRREFQPWSSPTLRVDTAGASPENSFRELLFALWREKSIANVSDVEADSDDLEWDWPSSSTVGSKSP